MAPRARNGRARRDPAAPHRLPARPCRPAPSPGGTRPWSALSVPRALPYFPLETRTRAVRLLIADWNVVAPFFGQLTPALKRLLPHLDEAEQDAIVRLGRRELQAEYALPARQAWAIQLVGSDAERTAASVDAVETTFSASKNPIVRREAIIALGMLGAAGELNRIRRDEATLHPFERRALIIAMARLGMPLDGMRLGAFDKIVAEWATTQVAE